IEGPGGEREREGVGHFELDLEPGLACLHRSGGEHLRAEVGADYQPARTHRALEGEREIARAGCAIEDAISGTRAAQAHRFPPPAESLASQPSKGFETCSM